MDSRVRGPQQLDTDVAADIRCSTLRRGGHFQFESGHHGDTWIDLEPLFVDQFVLSTIARDLAARVKPHSVDVVCGPLIGGALLGQLVAAELKLPFVFAERSTAEARARYRIPPSLAKHLSNRRVAIVDDAINAGSATLAARDEIIRAGGTAVVAAAIFLRVPGGVEMLASGGLAAEFLVGVQFTIWEASDCPLCRGGEPLVDVG